MCYAAKKASIPHFDINPTFQMCLWFVKYKPKIQFGALLFISYNID